jgi:hypothetical protein
MKCESNPCRRTVAVGGRIMWSVAVLAVLLIGVGLTRAAEPLPAPPNPGELAAANEMIRQAFGDQIAAAKTSQAQSELAGKLLNTAADSSNDARARYALLLRAQAMAAAAGDLDLQLQGVDATANSYRIDAPMARADVIVKWAEGRWSPTQALAGLALVQKEIQKLVGEDRYEPTDALLRAGRKLAYESRSSEARVAITETARSVAHAHQIFTAAVEGSKVLATKPGDAAAHLAVGRYLFFVKGDTAQALPHLAAGSDPKLAALARAELAKPTQAADQVKLADGWWAVAENEPASAAARIRDAVCGTGRRC